MTIEQRVAKLEKQNRWMKRGGGLVLAAVACVVLMGQGKGKDLPDLDARSLNILDKSGKRRVAIAIVRGNPFLSLHDESGKARIVLTTMLDGSPLLSLSGGKARADLALLRNSVPELSFKDNEGKRRVRLITMPEGFSSKLAMYDSKGNVTWQAPPKK